MAKSKGSSILTIIGVIAILAGLWVHSMMSIPIVKIPTPVMPSPNAYDFYIKAANSIQDMDKIAYALENYKQPQSSMGTDARPYSLAEKEVLLKHNAAVFSLLRQGMGYKYMTPPDRSSLATSTGMAALSRTRDLARLLAFDAQVKSAKGDWNGAMNSQIDGIQLGTDVPRGGAVITMLIGNAVQAIGRKDVWATIDHLNANQARAAARRMEGINSRIVPFSDVLTEEKWTMLTHDFGMSTVGAPGSASVTPPSGLQRFTYRKRQAVLGQYMDQLIACAKQPYAAKVPFPKAPGLMADIQSLGGGQIAGMLGPVFIRANFVHVKCEAMSKLLTVNLALRAYKADHGKYPASLADLTPSYLTTIPSDPFALRGQLQYRLIGAKYVLYSIGPDGKDDGGKVIINPSKPLDWRYFVDDKIKGDIVAGINK